MNELREELLSLGFKSVEIEELDDIEKSNEDEIWVKVRFNWKWNDRDQVNTDGRQEFHTNYEYAIPEIMAFIKSRESWTVLLT
ncbi:hypothetical protein [Paenibacillus xylanexedens]|uniref:hypothetical protein n=1 Tax=Paenibacillus xylanexedens TaxID=528191 RepID=UPI00119CEA42|nr:hypothetical protein [Paenibacillus xylanexedens]